VNALAKWLSAQRARRIVFIAGLFPLPGIGLLSAAAVIMAAELRGARDASIDCLVALLLVAGMAWLAVMEVPLLVTSAAVSWSVWLVLGGLMHRSGSLTLAIQAALMLALLAMLLLPLVIGDPVAYWADLLEAVYSDLAEQGVAVDVELEQQAKLMGGLLLAGSLIGTVIALILGNFWANAVRETAGRDRFRQLRLGYIIGGLAGIAGVAELLGVETYGVLLVFGAACMFQGMAVVAWWAHKMAWPRGWWIGLCILLILLPSMLIAGLVLFAAIGFIDNWYSLRRKLA